MWVCSFKGRCTQVLWVLRILSWVAEFYFSVSLALRLLTMQFTPSRSPFEVTQAPSSGAFWVACSHLSALRPHSCSSLAHCQLHYCFEFGWALLAHPRKQECPYSCHLTFFANTVPRLLSCHPRPSEHLSIGSTSLPLLKSLSPVQMDCSSFHNSLSQSNLSSACWSNEFSSVRAKEAKTTYKWLHHWRKCLHSIN